MHLDDTTWHAKAGHRRNDAAAPQPLDPRTTRLFDSLPPRHRLFVVRNAFPHVANRLAADWFVPRRTLANFDDLMMDCRGSRSGFPFEAALELMQLREYYVETLHPELRVEAGALDADSWR